MSISNQDAYIDGSELANEIKSIKDDICWNENQIDGRESETNNIAPYVAALVELKEELAPLEELETDCYLPLQDISLIARDEFQNYCFRLAVDCGDISEDSAVASHVNWEAFADALEIDFKSVDFDGEEYLHRS